MMTFSEKMTFSQRVGNTISLGIGKYFFPYISKGVVDVFRSNFGQDFPDLDELTRETSLWFYNAEPLIEFPRPIFHKTIDIGGISVSAGPKPLNKVCHSFVTLSIMIQSSDMVGYHESPTEDCSSLVRNCCEELPHAR